ncbi:hypothetical protein JHK82_043967 [Glycine max]|nr:hypothetical protein JHK82_043967 [Glycine max]
MWGDSRCYGRLDRPWFAQPVQHVQWHHSFILRESFKPSSIEPFSQQFIRVVSPTIGRTNLSFILQWSPFGPPSASDDGQDSGFFIEFDWKVVLIGYGRELVAGMALGRTFSHELSHRYRIYFWHTRDNIPWAMLRIKEIKNKLTPLYNTFIHYAILATQQAPDIENDHVNQLTNVPQET